VDPEHDILVVLAVGDAGPVLADMRGAIADRDQRDADAAAGRAGGGATGAAGALRKGMRRDQPGADQRGDAKTLKKHGASGMQAPCKLLQARFPRDVTSFPRDWGQSDASWQGRRA